jgi:hypothetical protein
MFEENFKNLKVGDCRVVMKMEANKEIIIVSFCRPKDDEYVVEMQTPDKKLGRIVTKIYK